LRLAEHGTPLGHLRGDADAGTEETGGARGKLVYIHVAKSPATIDLSACKGCRCLIARRHARAVTRLFEAKLRPHGLRATQFSVLAALALKGPTPVTELAGLLGLERTTLTRIAALLERHGWLDVAGSPDRRQRRFRLTSGGRRKLEGAFPAWKQAQEQAERRFGPPTRQGISAAL
jgi:DNA-binding MarR family transcriptional regulator